MSEKMPTWWEIIKTMPAFTVECYHEFVDYWRNAPPREWIAETLWLGILVAIFYYGVHGVIDTMAWASASGVNPNGLVGILLTFAPLIIVFAIFFANYVFSGIIRTIFKWQDGR